MAVSMEAILSNQPNNRELLTIWRRRLFLTWIVVAVIAAATAMIGGPFVSTDGSDFTRYIALVSPIAMFTFLITASAWLVLTVLTHRSRYDTHPPRG